MLIYILNLSLIFDDPEISDVTYNWVLQTQNIKENTRHKRRAGDESFAWLVFLCHKKYSHGVFWGKFKGSLLENIQKMFNSWPKLDAVSEVTLDIDVGFLRNLRSYLTLKCPLKMPRLVEKLVYKQ